jgi:hypothetical protein
MNEKMEDRFELFSSVSLVGILCISFFDACVIINVSVCLQCPPIYLSNQLKQLDVRPNQPTPGVQGQRDEQNVQTTSSLPSVGLSALSYRWRAKSSTDPPRALSTLDRLICIRCRWTSAVSAKPHNSPRSPHRIIPKMVYICPLKTHVLTDHRSINRNVSLIYISFECVTAALVLIDHPINDGPCLLDIRPDSNRISSAT